MSDSTAFMYLDNLSLFYFYCNEYIHHQCEDCLNTAAGTLLRSHTFIVFKCFVFNTMKFMGGALERLVAMKCKYIALFYCIWHNV